MYWAAGCGGCEISVLNLHEALLDVLAAVDLVFCPCLVDTKTADLEAMPDGDIDITLFDGALRTQENIEMAHLLRRKSKIMIAYGSCANSGCVPGLSNLFTVEELQRTAYTGGPSAVNPQGVFPAARSAVPEGTLTLPLLAATVRPLRDEVWVDYAIPGCPPEPARVAEALQALLGDGEPPAPGAVLASGPSSVCLECSRRREGKVITEFRRVWEIDPDPELCLMEQGLVCMGPATRQGCGGLCPSVNMPCIGCYGAVEGTRDQGVEMAGVIGGAIDVGPARGLPDAAVAQHADAVLDGVPDWVGTFYKFTLPASQLEAVTPRPGASKRPEPARPAPRRPEAPALPAPRRPAASEIPAATAAPPPDEQVDAGNSPLSGAVSVPGAVPVPDVVPVPGPGAIGRGRTRRRRDKGPDRGSPAAGRRTASASPTDPPTSPDR